MPEHLEGDEELCEKKGQTSNQREHDRETGDHAKAVRLMETAREPRELGG